MSRVGKQPIAIADNVQVKIQDRTVTITGPKGSLSMQHHDLVTAEYDQQGKVINISRHNDNKFSRALHGLTRALLANMVSGVTSGFEKVVLIEGIGYSAAVQGRNLVLTVGFAKPVTMELPQGVEVAVPSAQRIVFTGMDKQAVNAFAAMVRLVRRADPYHQKGMRYEGEVVRKKAGKAFASGPA